LDFHSEGWISDNEIKNVNIETSARVEHLIATDKFDSTVPKELFRFCFEASYKNHTTKELPKPMWRALRTEAERKLSTLQTLKQTDLFMYRAKLLTTWAMYARYYDEDIKFEGEKLTADPNTIPVGRQHT